MREAISKSGQSWNLISNDGDWGVPTHIQTVHRKRTSNDDKRTNKCMSSPPPSPMEKKELVPTTV